MNNSYTAFLMGGLGNQMFQIANVLSKSYDDNVNSVFRKTSFTPMQGRDTSFYIKNIFEKIIFSDDIKVDIRVNEIDWSYNDLIYPKKNNIEFYGYYQSSKNFKNNINKIKEIFQPSDLYKQNIIKKYPEILNKNTLSIHVRRGDSFKNLDVHPVITKSYIHESLKKIPDVSTVFIFTDDKQWCKNNLNFDKCIYVDEEDYIELWMMSMCQNNIISNSTFSWWGSFLNNNTNKIVVAPSIWFGPKGPKKFKDIYESYWDIINVNYDNGYLEYVNHN